MTLVTRNIAVIADSDVHILNQDADPISYNAGIRFLDKRRGRDRSSACYVEEPDNMRFVRVRYGRDI